MKFGFIGYRNHAKKLLKLVDETGLCSDIIIYHPDYEKLSTGFSGDDISCKVKLVSKLEDLFDSEAIFIASPTSTHWGYLNVLNNKFHGYIFCEKPPCNNLDELRSMRELDSRKIFFNFNYRYSEFARVCKTAISTGEFGIPISLNCCGVHGLAFKPSFSDNWRNLSESVLENVIGNVGIHYVDLAVYLLGKGKRIFASYQKVSQYTKICDSALVTVETEKSLSASILLSYASPFRISLRMFFSDAIVDYVNGTLSVQKPRDTFDNLGFFAPPPERILMSGSNADIAQSLRNSVAEFIKVVRNSSCFSRELFDCGLDSTKLLLTLPWTA